MAAVCFKAPAAWQTLGVTEVRVAPRGPGDKGRAAKVALKAGKVMINRPEGRGLTEDPENLELGLVEARGINAPEDVAPLPWRLVTTLPVATCADAEDVVRSVALAHRGSIPHFEERWT
jgi:hypothetical protein